MSILIGHSSRPQVTAQHVQSHHSAGQSGPASQRVNPDSFKTRSTDRGIPVLRNCRPPWRLKPHVSLQRTGRNHHPIVLLGIGCIVVMYFAATGLLACNSGPWCSSAQCSHPLVTSILIFQPETACWNFSHLAYVEDHIILPLCFHHFFGFLPLFSRPTVVEYTGLAALVVLIRSLFTRPTLTEISTQQSLHQKEYT